MAKPISHPPTAGPSSLVPQLPTSASQHTRQRPPTRRHRQRLTRRSGVFALFATICASSSAAVDAHPVEPPHTSLPFLYPFIDDASVLASLHSRSDDPPAPYATAVPSSASVCLQERSNLPDKYVKGSDGLWRKTTEWSLYGSTNCAGYCSSPSTASIPANIDDQASAPSSDSVSSMQTASLDDFDESLLPTGWKIQSEPSRGLTIAILVLSLALAIIICIMMISCVMWRRKRRREIPKDVEKKLRKKKKDRADSDDELPESVRQAEVTQKKWVRATSRWRANIRHAARRRRTDRLQSASSATLSVAQDEDDVPTVPDRSTTPVPSRSASRVSSHHSTETDDSISLRSTPSIEPLEPESEVVDEPTPMPTAVIPFSQPVDTPSHPPAYHPSPHDLAPPDSTLLPPNASPEYPSEDSIPASSKPSTSAASAMGTSFAGGQAHSPAYTGHVATDDKALLARRAAMISAPPIEDRETPLPFPVSVPALDDEELPIPSDDPPPSPDACARDSETRPPYSPPASGLPPPPSKGKMAAPRYDDYPFTFEEDDIVDVEPHSGPSAPPFEESPSAPPFEEEVLPSAPPLPPEDVEDPPPPSAPPDLQNVGAACEAPGPGGRISPAAETETGE